MLPKPVTSLPTLPVEGGTLDVRPIASGDMPFVLDSWIKSYQSSAFAIRLGHNYRAVQEKRARWCMGRGQGIVAVDPDAPDIVLGWACGVRDPATLDYVYVMRDARKRNIGRLLCMTLLGGEPDKVRMTHRVRKEHRSRLPQGWVWLPLTREEMGDA